MKKLALLATILSSLTACATWSGLDKIKADSADNIEQIQFPVAQVFRDIYLKGSESVLELQNPEELDNKQVTVITTTVPLNMDNLSYVTIDGKKYIQNNEIEKYFVIKKDATNQEKIIDYGTNISQDFIEPNTNIKVGISLPYEPVRLTILPTKIYDIPKYATIGSSGQLMEKSGYFLTDYTKLNADEPIISRTQDSWSLSHTNNPDFFSMNTATLCWQSTINNTIYHNITTLNSCRIINENGDVLHYEEEMSSQKLETNFTRYFKTPKQLNPLIKEILENTNDNR